MLKILPLLGKKQPFNKPKVPLLTGITIFVIEDISFKHLIVKLP